MNEHKQQIMEAYKKVTTEASQSRPGIELMKSMVDRNTGRGGKPVLNLNGDEIKDSVVISENKYAVRNKDGISIVEYNLIDGVETFLTFNESEFQNLKQL